LVSRRLLEYLRAADLEEGGVRETVYRIYHESFADFVRSKVVAGDRRRLEKRLADYVLGWDEREGYGRRYALRFGPRHLLAAGRVKEATGLLLDWRFLDAKTAAGLVFELAEDFSAVAAELPEGKERRWLDLLEEAIRRDIHFIEQHREDYPQALFQCLWNSCWWYDCLDAAQHYVEKRAPGQGSGLGLHRLLEGWRARKEQAEPGFGWLRSLRPPPLCLGGPQKAVLRGHEGRVNSVSYSPDGRYLASASDDGTTRLWNTQSGACLLHLRGHERAAGSQVFSPDGRQLVTGSWEAVRVWDLATGAEVMQFQVPDHGVISLDYSLDSRHIAASLIDIATVTLLSRFSVNRGFGNGTVRVWEAASGIEVLALRRTDGLVHSLRFSPDGKLIVGGSGDWNVWVWDAQTGVEQHCLQGHQSEVLDAAFSPNGQFIVSGSSGQFANERVCYSAAGGGDSSIRVWDAHSGAQLTCIKGHNNRVYCVAVSPDSRWIASGSRDRTVRIWDMGTGAQLKCLRGHEGFVFSVAFSPDGHWLASASDDATIRIWDLLEGGDICELVDHKYQIADLSFSTDGRWIVSAAGIDRSVRVWEAMSGRLRYTVRIREGLVWRVTFSPDGQQIYCGIERSEVDEENEEATIKGLVDTVLVWDFAKGEHLTPCTVTPDIFPAVVPGAYQLRAGCRNQELVIEVSATGEPVAWFPQEVQQIATHPSSRIWVGRVRNYLCLLALEGNPQPPPDAPVT
jgi:WD40 repeat protein